ncbi:MAG: putative lipid II flippase FtsW [Succinatimonas hippei]|nr:putative lipid II flippase FtsW [Succinatimonas hippei]
MTESRGPGYDRGLFVSAALLMLISVVLIASASVMESKTLYGSEFFLLKKHVISMAAALFAALIAAMIPTKIWQRYAMHLLILNALMLVLVLIVGRNVNEARRWINIGVFNVQPAEFMKLCWIIYFSSFASRKIEEVRTKIKGFIKPMVLLAIVAVLLLEEPDFGSCVVIAAICMGILLIAGSPMVYYVMAVIALAAAGTFMVVTQPYRLRRVTSFLDPWADQFGSGYQLTQSLMAFGRGGLTGQGLGNSIQKLGYLPEAHTDFVTAILGEEFGFIGMCVVILIEFYIVYKALKLGIGILRNGPVFQGFVSVGIGLLFCLQTTINIGVASGALPTKGLTLPLVSFGGSSMIVCCCAVAVLLRIDFELRHHQIDLG